MGLITIERAFPLILGSNIGTTITGILAAFSSSGSFESALQIALCHTLFNVTGILIWYPIPQIRKIPISIAVFISSKTEKYRWVAILYLLTAFLIVPLFFFALSVAGM
jgi:sodium-dependent phosphate cotransporter